MGEVPDREDGADAADRLEHDDEPGEPDDDGSELDEPDAGGDGGRGRGAGGSVAELPPLERGALVEILEFLAKSLVAEPDKVAVDIVDREGGVTLRLSVDQPDMGKVIGRSGRTARAIRTLMRAAGTRAGLHTYVEIVES